MSCYHPLKGFQIGLTENGKPDYKITSYNIKHIEKQFKNGHMEYIKCDDDYISPLALEVITDFIEIPCGKCIGCRLDYSRRWADRCMLELREHKEAWFVTLTYDDFHLPYSTSVDSDSGEIQCTNTLVKKDLQNFMKRLRKNTGQELRYFACGEYGSNYARPHYHLIIYGLHLPNDDLSLHGRSQTGEFIYNSHIIDTAWQFRGYAVLGSVTYESCAYVSRYIVKKLTGPQADLYTDLNIQPEFTLMSRKPGIAKNYYLDHPECFEYDYINLSTSDGGRKIQVPKYFENLYEIDYPELSEERKLKRQELSKAIQQLRQDNSSKSYLEMLKDDELNKLSQIKSLKRRCE